MSANQSIVVTEEEASQLLRLSARTLQRMRSDGSGPSFVRLAGRRVAYPVTDLETWVRDRIVSRQTRGEGGE